MTILTSSLFPPKKVFATLSWSTSARVLTRSMMGIILDGCLLCFIAWYMGSCPPTIQYSLYTSYSLVHSPVFEIRTVSIIITSSLSRLRSMTCSVTILVVLSPRAAKDLARLEMAACRRNIGGQTVLTKDILMRGGREARMGWEQHLVRTWRRTSVLLRGDKREGRIGCLRRGESSVGRAG